MDGLLREYLPILIFLVIAVGLTVVMLSASLLLGKQNPDSEKLSPYECGFEAFDDARRQFDVRFYLVSILFIIFDLEVAFLFPWAVTLGEIGVGLEDAVMIGDTTFAILMARNAGTSAVGVSWGVHEAAELREAGAHHVVDANQELLPTLERLAAGREDN